MKSARAKIVPASLSSAMCCLSGDCGMANRMRIANAIGYAMHSSRSHDAVIRVYAALGSVIATHEHKGGFREC